MAYIPELKAEVSAYGDNLITELKPYVTLRGTYGMLDEVTTFTANGGTASVISTEFTCQTGTSAGGYSTILSRHPIVNVPGLGSEARISARFSTPIANSIQVAGFFSASDGMFFGYDGTQFGVVHRHHGTVEMRTLTVTAATATSVTVTVTLNGTAYTANITAGTVHHNAHEIAAGLNASAASAIWFIQNINNTVVFTSKLDGVKSGAYSATVPSGIFTSTLVQNTAGVAAIEDVVPQSAWNVDTCSWLIPSKGNVYKVEYGYLGYGVLRYSVFNPAIRRFTLCHVINWGNSNTQPNFGNPSFRVGWVAGSRGSSGTNIAVRGASALAGCQGNASRNQSFGAVGVAAGVSAETQILTCTVRREFGGRACLGVVVPKILSISTDSVKGSIFGLYLNPSVNGDTLPSYVNQTQSICVFDTLGLTISGGKLIGVFSTGPQGQAVVDLSTINTLLTPGDSLVITAQVTSGAASEMTASLTWEEIV